MAQKYRLDDNYLAAFNTTNGKINSVLAALEAAGILATE